MSVENDPADREPEGEDRREPNGQRTPYDAIVELGGSLGPSFEARAVDISRGGMHIRTAYLPELGQPLTCRFDAGGGEVLASGEVVWRQEEGRGGDFALRFEPLDQESMAAIGKLVAPTERHEPKEAGARVRLHIDGLGSPMRARVRGACPSELTVGSELGFLQVGKDLELEDATTGERRPARIDRVEVEVDESSKIPQLVVTLRYTDEVAIDGSVAPRVPSPAPHPRAASKPDGTPEPSVIDGEAKAQAPAATADQVDSLEQMRTGLGTAISRAAAQLGPTLGKFAKQARTTLALLATRTTAARDGTQTRRTTAPAPGGGLRASGRRVVRSESPIERSSLAPGPLRGLRPIGLVAAFLCAALLSILVLRKHPAPPASASAAETSTPPIAASARAADTASPPLLEPASGQTLGAPPQGASASDPPAEPSPTTDAAERGHHKPGRVASFGNGTVTHGNVLRIKMDGAIEKIEGASLPTGFTVVVPNRRSLEAAAPLAARDSRIASIRVANEAHGAELTVAFKDGVPNYQVRAKGDTLELVLASTGRVLETEPPHDLTKPVAKKGRRLVHDKN